MNHKRIFLYVAGCLVGLSLAGCAQQAKEASKAAVKEAAPSGMEGLSRPETLQALDKIASSPAIEHAAQQVAHGLVKGAIGTPPSATQPASANLAANTSATSQPATRPTLSGFSPQQMVPAMQSMVRSVGHEAVLASFGPDAQAQASAMSQKIARSAVQGTAQGVREDLGPAVTSMIRDQVGPAMAESVRRDMGPAIQDLMTRQIAPGVQQIVRQSMQGALGEFTQGLQSPVPTQTSGAQPAATTLGPGNEPAAIGGRGIQPAGLELVARDVSRGTVLGVGDAIGQMGPQNSPIPTQATMTRMMWIAIGTLVIIGLLAVVNTLGLFVLALAIWRSRRSPA